MFGIMFGVLPRHPDEPVVKEFPKCPWCKGDWHGLPNENCLMSSWKD